MKRTARSTLGETLSMPISEYAFAPDDAPLMCSWYEGAKIPMPSEGTFSFTLKLELLFNAPPQLYKSSVCYRPRARPGTDRGQPNTGCPSNAHVDNCQQRQFPCV